MKRTAKEVADFVGGELRGDGSIVLDAVASLNNAGPSHLTYAEEKFHGGVKTSGAGCVVVRSGDFETKTVILSRNPKLAFAQAAAWILSGEREDSGIHPAAIIASGVRIGARARIGATAVIESGVQIGDSSVIEAGCYVGKGSSIGANCVLYPRVVIYAGVEIGNRVTVHAGAVIGADGFGYVKNGDQYVKFPQIGKVVIEDDVEIGANTCIDRGSLETTFIRRGTKLDNLIQIAHNVQIGKHTVIAAQTGISGSSTVGDNSILGGQVGIGEHAHLDPSSIIGGQGGVLNGKRIRGGELLWGTPVRPLKDFLEQQALIARLPRMAKILERLKSRLDKLEDKPGITS